MQLDARGDLAAAEIAFYVPSFLLSVAVCFKQGWTRNAGWLYMVLLSVLRIIGASCLLYIETQQDESQSLLETAAITSAIGTAPLLLALMGLLQRIHLSMRDSKGFSEMLFRPFHIIGLLALVLAIIGGVKESKNAADAVGKDCREAASILFLAIYVGLAIITLLTALRISHVASAEKTLIIVATCALPFLLVRIAYTVGTGFSDPGSPFYFLNANVWIEAFMLFAMEALVLCLYIAAGLLTPKQTPRVNYDGAAPNSTKAANSIDGSPDVAYAPQQSRPSRQARPMQLSDYRPSRMIRNAINDRF